MTHLDPSLKPAIAFDKSALEKDPFFIKSLSDAEPVTGFSSYDFAELRSCLSLTDFYGPSVDRFFSRLDPSKTPTFEQGILLLQQALFFSPSSLKGQHTVIGWLMNSRFYEGRNAGSVSNRPEDACPLELLLNHSLPSRRKGLKSNHPLTLPDHWCKWTLQCASHLKLSDTDQKKLYLDLLEHPHPNALKEALKQQLCIAPLPHEATAAFKRDIESLNQQLQLYLQYQKDAFDFKKRLNYFEFDSATLIRVDAWQKMGTPLPDLSITELSEALEASATFWCSKNLTASLLTQAHSFYPSLLTDAFLNRLATLNTEGQSPLGQSGRSLATILNDTGWSKAARVDCATKMILKGCNQRDANIVMLSALHCPLTEFAPLIKKTFSAAFLANLEKQILSRKEFTPVRPVLNAQSTEFTASTSRTKSRL